MKFKNNVIDFASFSYTTQEPASIIKHRDLAVLPEGTKNQIMVYARPVSILKCSTTSSYTKQLLPDRGLLF